MGKKVKKSRTTKKSSHEKAPKHQAKYQKPESEDEGKLDEFYDEREKILLQDEDTNGGDFGSESEEDIYGVDGLDTDEEQEVIAQVPGLRKYLKKTEDAEESEEEDAMAWGNRKGAFYNDDADYDDEAIADELEEAQNLQKARLETMAEDDFLDDFQESMGKKKKSDYANLAQEDDAAIVKEMDEELEKIDLGADEIKEKFSGNKKEIMAHITSDSPELVGLLSEFSEKVDTLKHNAASLLEKIRNGELVTEDGVSLLDVKNQLMVNYMLNLSFYFYLKVSGKKINDHPVIKKLVELRLFMEKLKPIERKLKPQIDRMLKSAVTAGEGSQDALNFKADPSAFDVEDGEDEENDGVYRPPKIAPVPFDETGEEKDSKLRVSKASERMMKDALSGFTEAPEEIVNAGDVFNVSTFNEDDWKERMRVEEELMTRLPMKKTEKKSMKKKLKNELEDLDDFGDASFLDTFETSKSSSSMNKKRSAEAQNEAQLDESSESENEYYLQLKSARESKKASSKENDEFVYPDEDTGITENGKRKVNYQIMKNKGLTPKRSKEQRNPRVKRRKKYEQSQVKLKSFKSVMKDQSQPYRGEETGIKKNLSRGVRFQ